MLSVLQNALRMQKLIFFGKNFLCKCEQPILKQITSKSGKVEFISVVQNRTESASDTEILLESFSDEDEEQPKKVEVAAVVASAANGSGDKSNETDLKSQQDAAEIRRLLRRKDELERKQKSEEKYNERLQVSAPIKYFTTWCSIVDISQSLGSSRDLTIPYNALMAKLIVSFETTVFGFHLRSIKCRIASGSRHIFHTSGHSI